MRSREMAMAIMFGWHHELVKGIHKFNHCYHQASLSQGQRQREGQGKRCADRPVDGRLKSPNPLDDGTIMDNLQVTL